MKHLFAVFLTATLGLASSVAQELPFTHYTTEKEVNPLPSSNIPMTYQDQLGYIWFVVYSSGLARYNGNTMQLFTDKDGLPALDVRQIVEDSTGRLWVASEAGIAVSTKPLSTYGLNERIAFADTVDGQALLNLTVTENRMCVDRNGTLWVGSRGRGIIRYRFEAEGTLKVDTLSTEFGAAGQHRDVRSLCLRADGSVWAALGGGLLAAFDSTGLLVRTMGEGDGVPKSDSDVMRETSAGALIAGTFTGQIWTLQGEAGKGVVEMINSPMNTRITGITEDSKGRIWISSQGSGLLVIDDPTSRGRQRHFTIRNGLLSDLVSHVMEDYEGNIWISQIGGVSKLRENFGAFLSFTSYSREDLEPYLRNANVNTVVPQRSDSPYEGIWVATSGGGVTYIGRDNTIARFGAREGLKSDWINGITLDKEGRLWIASSLGINCLSLVSGTPPPRGQSRRILTLPQGLAVLTGYGYRNSTMYSCDVFPLKGGTGNAEAVWFSAYQAVYMYAGDQWYVFRNQSGLPETYFTSVHVDSAGLVWVGTRDAGLYRSKAPVDVRLVGNMKTRVFQTGPGGGTFGNEVVDTVFNLLWDVSRGAPSNQVESIVSLDRTLWVGNPEGLVGMRMEDLSTKVHITMAEGLPGNDVTSLAVANHTRTLWLGTNGGMAEVEPRTGRVLRTLTKRDGIIDNEVWWYGSIRIGEDGSVYFGTAKGLSLFNPAEEHKNETPPVVRFELIQQQGSLSSNAVLFSFAALSFSDESRVRYSTFMEGYEDDWSGETKDVTTRYTNLPAFFVDRQYTFHVRARNGDSVWTRQDLRYSFEVEPPWWFRWWFTALNLSVVVGLSYAFFYYRTLKLQQRSRELERTVEERTEEIRQKATQISKQAAELTDKNVELEEKNAEILRTQEQLIVQEKLASLGALTAGIAHEIKNPLNFVNNFSEVSVEIAQELKEDIQSLKDTLDPGIFKRLEDSCLDLGENAAKINEHGRRADGIVKGMLEHSRGQTGQREPTNLNALLDEYMTLAYHGLKAQEPECNVKFEKHFDDSIGMLDVFPADLSRVFLNVVNNACYSVFEKQKVSGRVFSPLVTVTTLNGEKAVEVRIRDNGSGIPKAALEKIFNPFFTTKPTGKGTGLGLSLSHDIIVQQHGGRIEVDTEEGSYAEFRIILPKTKAKSATP